jgi:hypothetical protein
VSDRDEIVDVLVRYATGIDQRDWALFRTCFTDDCALDYGDIGTWHSADAVTQFMAKSHSGPSVHRLTNFVVTVDGDTAEARTYVDAVVLGPGGWGGAHTIGIYDDRLTRTSAGWRIASRRFTNVRLRMLGATSVVPSALASRLAKRMSARPRIVVHPNGA